MSESSRGSGASGKFALFGLGGSEGRTGMVGFDKVKSCFSGLAGPYWYGRV